jgi:hypothetical protein
MRVLNPFPPGSAFIEARNMDYATEETEVVICFNAVDYSGRNDCERAYLLQG